VRLEKGIYRTVVISILGLLIFLARVNSAQAQHGDWLLGTAGAIAGAQREKHLSREEFARMHGAHPDALAKVREFAREYNLTIDKELPSERSVVLSGTVAAMSTAFGNVELHRYDSARGPYRGRTGEILVPDDLAPHIEAVTGLDNRPVARPHFRWSRSTRGSSRARAANDGSFTTPQVAQLYDFPTGLNGSGQCIGICELGDSIGVV
jgi:kumamolisin